MKFLRTKNIDDCEILIPISKIDEIVLHDNDNDDGFFSILIFSNAPDEVTAIAREDFDTADEVRRRFSLMEKLLNKDEL